MCDRACKTDMKTRQMRQIHKPHMHAMPTCTTANSCYHHALQTKATPDARCWRTDRDQENKNKKKENEEEERRKVKKEEQRREKENQFTNCTHIHPVNNNTSPPTYPPPHSTTVCMGYWWYLWRNTHLCAILGSGWM